MQTRIEHNKRKARYAFASLPELGRYLDDTPRTWSAEMSRKNPSATSWDLNAGYDEAVRLSKDGWIEGVRNLEATLKHLPPATPKPQYRNDFYGHTPNVPRYCAGAPDSMIRHAADAYQGMRPVLTLYVPVNATAGVSAESMANFGAAVVSAINQIEANGHRVELYGAICSLVSGHRVTHSFLIKDAGQGFDLATVAFAIGHPAMFRRLGFALRERCAVREDYAYGRSVPMTLADLIDPAPGAYILNGMTEANQYASTPEHALRYVTGQINKAIASAELAA